jgi:uncharacterized protein YndB with AHSA1/START domain
MTVSSTDKIEKNVVLKAPRGRVWRAISDSKEFGQWFQIALDGPFEPGARVGFTITTPGKYEGVKGVFVVGRVEPENFLSFRWHPFGVDKEVDYSKEQMTLVTFELSDVKEGTALRIVESGFDAIPEARRALAYRMNDGGWTEQLKNIARYVGAPL